MWSLQLTVNSVECVVHIVGCAVQTVECTEHLAECKMYSVEGVECAVCSVQYSVHCAVWCRMCLLNNFEVFSRIGEQVTERHIGVTVEVSR